MAVSNETLKLLAQYIGGMAAQSTTTDVAKQILLRSQIDWNTPNYKPKGAGGPSVVSRIFDILSRPNYAMANVNRRQLEDLAQGHYLQLAKDVIDVPGNLSRTWRGLSGKDKTTFTDTLLNDPLILDNSAMGDVPRPLRAALGLTLDVAGDPTTYVGPGVVKGIGKSLGITSKAEKIAKVGTASKALEAVPAADNAVGTTLDVLGSVKRAEAAIPEAKVALPASKTFAKSITWSPKAVEGAQGITRRLLSTVETAAPTGKKVYGADFARTMRQYREVAAKTRSPGFYGQVQRAEQLLNRIHSGAPEAVSRVKPKPPVEVVRATQKEKSLAVMIGRQAKVKIKTGPQKAFNPKQQLTIFHSLLRKTTGTPIERMTRATAMMREAEKYLESQGHVFKFWDGTAIKLTDIFDELGHMSKVGPEILSQLEKGRINNPMLDQAVEALRARNAMQDSRYVVLGLDNVTEQAAHAAASTSPARAEQITSGLTQDLRRGLKTAGVSPAAQGTANALFKQILNTQSPPIQRVLSGQVAIAHDIMNNRASAVQKITREQHINAAIERHMGSPYRTVATKLGNENKAVEFLGERFAAHYGQSLIRPISQDFNLSAIANAHARARNLSIIAKSTTKDQRFAAFKAAQHMGDPSMLPPVSSVVDNVALTFRTEIERLFSSTGIKDTAQSVSTRAAFTMEDINKELRRVGSNFQFTAGKVEDALTGKVIDYSKNIDWLKSWETHVLGNEDPLKFLSQMQLAAERVSRRYAMLDEIGARFGSTVRQGPFQHLAADPRLTGRYFSKDVATQINRMNQVLKGSYTPQNNFIKFIDRVTSAWKAGVTIYAPSHHIRNFIGDAWLSWIAGVNNPKRYTQAGRVLKANKDRYAGALVEDLVGPNALQRAMVRPGAVITRTKGGIPLTAEQIYIGAHQRGLLLGARQLEDIYAEPLMPRVFGGKVQHAAQKAAEVREHTVRLAHFIDAVSKNPGRNIKEVMDEAAHVVRKWHPDGMDLTDFERKYMRRLFPFYSWTRKAFPLVLESMVLAPGKVVSYPKGMEALQGAMGIQGVSRDDPFPSDAMIPDWLKEKGVGPIAASGMGGLPGMIAGLSRQGVDKTGQPVGGYTVVNPSNPMIDMIAQFGGMGNPRAPLQGAGSMLNPLARVPIEVTSGRQLYTDVPISYDTNRYVTEQIPGGAIFSRLTNMGVGGPTVRGQREGMGNKEALINFLTAAGITGTGPYKSQVAYQNRNREAARNRKAIEELLRRSRGG